MDGKLNPSVAETVAATSYMAATGAEISRVTSHSEDEGRFVPGTLLGGRYRIIGLLGRGGMGEVYRATDLTLGQSVALKFLPEEASRNQRLLERFHGEVRVARLVSHPNVCRVYDIGEVEGMPFISMEYVDGEDLSSLLLRIGRLPGDKAVETARKLCAGLAAAHDRGVIHRDLKPQNIMMNRRGEVVIMDFGLAAIADQLSGAEVRNGTPAYMSPEQLKGDGVTAKSDLYALGLVLYELFTGKRPFDAKNVQQLIDMQESAHLTSMTSVAADIDPAAEKVIRRCLDPDPAKRPATALSVMAALPGGDPLAAALAAGETPSPEMVLAAGTVEGMARKYSVPCLALVALALLAAIPIRQERTAMVHAQLDQSPDVLAHQAREFAASFGYSAKPADSTVWLEHRGTFLAYLHRLPNPRKWDEWLAAEAPIRAMYRESPRALKAEPYGYVENNNPPQDTPGMTRATLDGNGRLRDFTGLPPDDAGLSLAVPPETVFRAAALDLAAFTETAPTVLPASPFDRRQAWKGPHPLIPNTELTFDIAWWKGRIVRAAVTFPYQHARAGSTTVSATTSAIRIGSQVLLWVGCFFVLLLAVRNWKLQRADHQGAWRVAVASFLLHAIGWMGSVHAANFNDLVDMGLSETASALLAGVMLGLMYLALEPAVRARWPHSIVTWNRVLAGRWLDAQVGSDILLGAAAGASLWALFKFVFILLDHTPGPHNWDVSLPPLLGTRQWVGSLAGNLGEALRLGLIGFMAIFGLRRILRNDLLGAAFAALLFTLQEGEVTTSQEGILIGAVFVCVYAALIFLLLRFGLVATLVAVFFANGANLMVLGGDWQAWYTASSLATFAAFFGVAAFAFWRSLGSQSLISGDETA
uniref:Serine/threonine protein kinase n=1 Tax=Solibacter usitatus (strain Ellin6076) TaxID=234267 RepID=Q026F8_SOLUE